MERCVVIEEGDPYLVGRDPRGGHRGRGQAGDVPLRRAERRRACGASWRGDTTPEPAPAPGKPPRAVPRAARTAPCSTALRELDCIVAGDIGCYTLGVLPPFEAMDTCVCMGAGIGVGLGLRHVLPPERGAARGQRHRRQHLRPQRHHRPGRDGLQPAADAATWC